MGINIVFKDLFEFYNKFEDIPPQKDSWTEMETAFSVLKEKYKGTSEELLFSSLITAEKDEISKKNREKTQLFNDLYRFYIKYQNPVEDHAFWENLVEEASQINNSYKNIPYLSGMAEKMILSIVNDIERKFKKAV